MNPTNVAEQSSKCAATMQTPHHSPRDGSALGERQRKFAMEGLERQNRLKG